MRRSSRIGPDPELVLFGSQVSPGIGCWATCTEQRRNDASYLDLDAEQREELKKKRVNLRYYREKKTT